MREAGQEAGSGKREGGRGRGRGKRVTLGGRGNAIAASRSIRVPLPASRFPLL